MTMTRPPSSRRWLAIGAGALVVAGLGLAGGYQAMMYYGRHRAEAALQQLTAALPPGYRLTWTALTVDPFRQAVMLDGTVLAAPQLTIPFGRVTINDVSTTGEMVTRAKLRIEPGTVDLVAFGKKPSLATLVLGTPLRAAIAAGYGIVEPVFDLSFDYSEPDSKVGIAVGVSAGGFGVLQMQGVLDQVTPAALAAVRQIATSGPSPAALTALSGIGLERVAGSMEDGGLVARMALLQLPRTVYTGGDRAKLLRDDIALLARSGLDTDEQAAVFRFAMGQSPVLRLQSTVRLDGVALGNFLNTTRSSAQPTKTITVSN